MPRRRFTIPISIVLFLAATLVGTYLVRKRVLECHMAAVLDVEDREAVLAMAHSWPSSANARAARGWTALHWGASTGDSELARALIRHGADVNARTVGGEGWPIYTPLIYAVDRGHHALAVMLLEAGADPEGARNDGDWPLRNAVAHGDTDMMRILLAHGADIERRDVNGYTVLLHAVAHEQPASVAFLLWMGADVRVHDKDRWTALHLATRQCRSDLAEQLLSYGADVNARNDDGKTPLAIARRQVMGTMVQLLITHRAKE
ncbi:MAG TPA: ankyrin repeat domain-containing protein [Planctomycetota bacterium]|nr:ankyrin repeat domain-containing protein [Planctomycetota bacterium]